MNKAVMTSAFVILTLIFTASAVNSNTPASHNLGANQVNESLMDAFRAARLAENKCEGLGADEAIAQNSKLTASDAASEDQFGWTVAIDGNTAVVGAYHDDGLFGNLGAAYVYVRSGTGWTQQAKLVPSDAGTADEFFGYSVGIFGDTIVVGASGFQIGSNIHQGAVYIFVRSGTTWTEQAKLTAPDGAMGDELGASVSIEGDTVVAGSRLDDDGAIGQGSVHVFTRAGSVWSHQQKLIASDPAAVDFFGSSTAISGETLVVGAAGKSSGRGAVYVFVRSGVTWTEQQKIVAFDAQPLDLFGTSVGISGETIIVGASDDDEVFGNQGSAYVFTRSGTTWTLQTKIDNPEPANSEQFGYSVAIQGDRAVIGTPGDARVAGGGAIYVYNRTGISWSPEPKLTAADAQSGDSLGWSVAISGGYVIGGAPFDDDIANMQGSAYIFRDLSMVWAQETLGSPADIEANDLFGFSVSISGDTAAIGSPHDDVGANVDQGSAYVFVRSGSGWSFQQKITAFDGDISDRFGSSVHIAGNTLVVGSPNAGGILQQGSVYIFTRVGSAWAFQSQITASDGSSGDSFGDSVAISGDTLVVGAQLDDLTTSDEGSAYVFVRSGTVWSQQQKLVAPVAGSGDQFGKSVDVFGDTVVVGVPNDDVAVTNDGAAIVFTRLAGVWSFQQTLFPFDPPVFGGFFGHSVAIFQDTIAVGAPFSGFALDAAYVFVRSGSSWTQQQKIPAPAPLFNSSFGESVALEGNTLVIGAPQHAPGGSAFIFERNSSVWTQTTRLFDPAASPGDSFGDSVAIAGDRVIVGAPNSDGPPSPLSKNLQPSAIDQGAALVFANQPFAPTAAAVSIGGRVTMDGRAALPNALVSMTDQDGSIRTARTNSFGRYRFDDVEVGQTIVIGLTFRRFGSASRVITVADAVDDLDFSAKELF